MSGSFVLIYRGQVYESSSIGSGSDMNFKTNTGKAAVDILQSVRSLDDFKKAVEEFQLDHFSGSRFGLNPINIYKKDNLDFTKEYLANYPDHLYVKNLDDKDYIIQARVDKFQLDECCDGIETTIRKDEIQVYSYGMKVNIWESLSKDYTSLKKSWTCVGPRTRAVINRTKAFLIDNGHPDAACLDFEELARTIATEIINE